MSKSKYRESGYYRMLWTEYTKRIPFTWHRTHKGAESIPRAYAYKGSVSSDYYHHMCEGAHGLKKFATESSMRIDWREGVLIHEDDLTYHLCAPDIQSRYLAEAIAQLNGKLAKFEIPNDKRHKCPICGERWPLKGKTA